MTKEIVSIQVGPYANYVGAHFWNLQDEYLATPIHLRQLSPAALFREIGPTARAYASGLRYAPRLQIIDASGAFGALSTDAGIVLQEYATHGTSEAWYGRQQPVVRQRIRHSSYIKQLHAEETATQPLSDIAAEGSAGDVTFNDIEYWSDYLKTRLHPRTCFSIPAVHHNVTNLQHFQTGTNIAKPLLDDLYDDLRFFLEDCDSFGGLNIITNADDAFAGITSAYLEHLLEEIGSTTPTVLFGSHDVSRSCTRAAASVFGNPFDPVKEELLSKHEALLAATCMDNSVEYIPLSSLPVAQIPNLHVSTGNQFHASAVLALTLDVALIPLRRQESLADLLSYVRPVPFATLGSLACKFPAPNTKLPTRRAFFDTEGTVNLSNVWHIRKQYQTRSGSQEDNPFRGTEHVCSRGIVQAYPAHSRVSLPVTVPIPFPPIFDSTLSLDRHDPSQKSLLPKGGVQLDQVAVMSGIATIPEDGRECLLAFSDALSAGLSPPGDGIEGALLSEAGESLRSRADDYENI